MCRDAVFFPQEAEEEVLGADVVVAEVSGLFDGVFDDFFRARGLRELAHGDHVGAALDELFDFEADLAEIDVEVFEDGGTNAGAFLDEAEQDVLGAYVFVVEALGLLIGEGHDFAGAVCETFKHSGLLSTS